MILERGVIYMKNVVVIYKSKYGLIKKYVKWFLELLFCDIFEIKNINIEKVMKYDMIILGGGFYVCNIVGIFFLKKNYKELQKKNLVVFGVGVVLYDDEVIKKLREVNFKDELNKIFCFYCCGVWDEIKMFFIDYIFCSFFKKFIVKKEC